MYTIRKQRKLDPNSVAQMDAFNDEYAEACKKLGVARETMDVTFEQAAEYLELSARTVQRYAYAKPPVLELSYVMVDRGFVNKQKQAMVTLDSVVEYVVWKRFNRRSN
jgi:hypothetical protein